MMRTVTQIIEIKPYQITAKFNSGEIRTINFAPLVEKFTILKNPEIFLKARIDDYSTICWDDLALIREIDGTVLPCPLDFSPETLYQLSTSQNN